MRGTAEAGPRLERFLTVIMCCMCFPCYYCRVHPPKPRNRHLFPNFPKRRQPSNLGGVAPSCPTVTKSVPKKDEPLPAQRQDAFQLYEDFFNGSDPEARDFLLMNGGADSSDDSSNAGSEEEMGVLRTAEPAPAAKSVEHAVGVEKTTSPGLDEQFRALLNSALLAAPQPASSGGAAQGVQVPKSWKYWKGLHRLRPNCPKSGVSDLPR
eukprot:s999_g20.t1